MQEAINSMFRWYKSSVVCYAYLSHVAPDSGGFYDITTSQWFKRGWTLQELIAPCSVMFFSGDWTAIGTRKKNASQISALTRIPESPLRIGYGEEHNYLVAQIMSWAKGRETTRIEDRAYSLLGLFNVYIPMLYGEGERAFTRLQEEIIKQSGDQSLFAWAPWGTKHPNALARSPDFFPYVDDCAGHSLSRRHSSSATSEGITAEFMLIPWAPDMYLAVLNYEILNLRRQHRLQGIFLRALDEQDRFTRCRYAWEDIWTSDSFMPNDDWRRVLGVTCLWRQALGNPTGPLKVSRVTIVHHLENEDEVHAVHQGNEGRYSAFKVQFDHFIPSNHTTGNECSLYMEERGCGWLYTFEIEPWVHVTGNLREIAIGFDTEFTTLCILSSLTPKMDRQGFNRFVLPDIIWTPMPLVHVSAPPQSSKIEDSLWVIGVWEGLAYTTPCPPGTLCLKLGHRFGSRTRTRISLGTSSRGTLHKGRIPRTVLELELQGRCPIKLRMAAGDAQDSEGSCISGKDVAQVLRSL